MRSVINFQRESFGKIEQALSNLQENTNGLYQIVAHSLVVNTNVNVIAVKHQTY